MNKPLIIFFLAQLLFVQSIFADAMPFKTKAQIDISFANENILPDSCGIICENLQTHVIDTFFNCQGITCISVNSHNLRLTRVIPNNFRVIFCFKEKFLTSPLLSNNDFSSYHHLLISEKDVEDITPIFKTSYSNYVALLLITILLELVVAFFFFRRYKIPMVSLKYVVYGNLITHPLLWIVAANFSGFMLGMLIGEPLVFIVEALFLKMFLKHKLKTKDLYWLSFLMNAVSFFLGSLVYFLIS